MLHRNLSSSIISRVFIGLLVSSVSTAFILLYSMSILYVHTFFSLVYLVTFLLGLLLGSFASSLFLWRSVSYIGITLGLYILWMASFFLLPFANEYYIYYSAVRIVLLFFILSAGLLTFILIKFLFLYKSSKLFLDVYVLLFLSIVVVLFLQIYATVPFAGGVLTCLLFFLSLGILTKKWIQLFGFLLLLVFSFTGFLFFQQFRLFYIPTIGENKTRLFELGTQIDFKSAQQSNQELLDIASVYTGELPTYKPIYSNGRYYGRLIGDLTQLNYADKTPYSVLYVFKDAPKVLILDSAGGSDVYLTHMLVSGEIDALERNQEVLNQIRDKESLYVGGIYHNRNTLFYRSSIRSYIATTNKTYDILALNIHKVLSPKSIFYLSEEERNLSVNALRDYLNILNPQGILFISIKTFSQEFNRAIALKVINTFKIASGIVDREILLKNLHLFETKNSINIIFSKRSFLEEKENLYLQKIESLGYTNVLSEDNEVFKNVQAILQENKNLTSRIPFNITPITDNWNNWSFQLAQDLNLWEKTPLNFSYDFMQYFLLILSCFSLIVLIYSGYQFKVTNLYKMGLGGFFSYFLYLGIAIGFSIVFALDLFNYLLANEFISGGWALATILMSRVVGVFISNHIEKIYTKIRSAFIFQILIDIILLVFLNFLTDYFIALPLVFKILVPVVMISFSYIFIFTPVISGFLWVDYMQNKETSSLRTSLLLGVIFGVCFASYMLFYISSFWILAGCILFLLMGFFFSLFLDKKSAEIDYLYSKERI